MAYNRGVVAAGLSSRARAIAAFDSFPASKAAVYGAIRKGGFSWRSRKPIPWNSPSARSRARRSRKPCAPRRAGRARTRRPGFAAGAGHSRAQRGIGWPAAVIGGALLAFLIWTLSRAAGPSPLTDVATGRPILMLIVITTTVVFGGMMLNAALFGKTADDAAQRFQRAREVFLVFSGICATVVGFYFGSATTTAPALPAVSLNVSLGQDGTIAAVVAGGAPPLRRDAGAGRQEPAVRRRRGRQRQLHAAGERRGLPGQRQLPGDRGPTGSAIRRSRSPFTSEELAARRLERGVRRWRSNRSGAGRRRSGRSAAPAPLRPQISRSSLVSRSAGSRPPCRPPAAPPLRLPRSRGAAVAVDAQAAAAARELVEATADLLGQTGRSISWTLPPTEARSAI